MLVYYRLRAKTIDLTGQPAAVHFDIPLTPENQSNAFRRGLDQAPEDDAYVYEERPRVASVR